MVSFFFLDNGNVTFDDKMLKIPIEDLNEISEKDVQLLDDFRVQHITKVNPYCICVKMLEHTVVNVVENQKKKALKKVGILLLRFQFRRSLFLFISIYWIFYLSKSKQNMVHFIIDF